MFFPKFCSQVAWIIRGNCWIFDLSILYQALNQKGLTIDNLKQYNNYRFSVIKTESFDAGNDNFPKLTCSNIVNEISKLKYNLKVTQLDLFLIELKKY